MFKWIGLALALIIAGLIGHPANAQNVNINCLQPGQTPPWQPDSAYNPCWVQSVGPGASSYPVATATLTRQSNTTQYNANSALCASGSQCVPLQFTISGIPSIGGFLTTARLTKSTTSLTNATFRLHLFEATPSISGIADNSSYATPAIADYPTYIGYFDFVAGVAGASDANFEGAPSQSLLGFNLASGSAILYGMLEATGTYTPGSAEIFDVRLVAKP